MRKRSLLVSLPVFVLATTLAFAAGFAASSVLIQPSVNVGLVQAFDAVGKNLFGNAVFGVVPPNPILPPNPIRIALSDRAAFPVAVEFFRADDPESPDQSCHTYLQIRHTPGGTLQLVVDETEVPEGFLADFEFESLAAFPPSPCPIDLGSD